MNLILRVILASIFSLPVAALFLVVGMGILFLTPFASAPLFGRLPGVSKSFCPEGASLIVERYSRRNTHAKNDYRVICLDSTGSRVADVSNQANFAGLGASAGVGYLIAWLALFRFLMGVIQEKAKWEKWFILGAFAAGAALFPWAASYIYWQPTNLDRERAAMVVLVVTGSFAAVFLVANHYIRKRSGKRL